jgi:ATP-binding cassette subfamily B multidrug efflux pump
MLAMMFWISPLLAIIALVTIPVSMVVTAIIGKRSQKLFVQQWKATGEVNGIVEESLHRPRAGQGLRPAGRGGARSTVRTRNCYDASFGAQFISGIIMPMMMFVGNLNYVAIAVVGGLRVASGSMSLGDVQAFIQYSRQFTQPLTQVASMANLMQSGVASAERVFEVLDAAEQEPDPTTPVTHRPPRRVRFEDVSFSYTADRPSSSTSTSSSSPARRWPSSGRPAPGKTTWSTSSCASTSSTAVGSPSTASTSPS